MRKLILIGASLAAAGAIAAPTAAKTVKCDAKYYGHLVGKDVSATQEITSDYKLIPASAGQSSGQQGRMVVRYDKKSNRITDVSCG